jgi:hypothetical protein
MIQNAMIATAAHIRPTIMIGRHFTTAHLPYTAPFRTPRGVHDYCTLKWAAPANI